MEDRVADILAARAALNRGAGTAIALSVLVHAGLAGAAIWAAMHQQPPQTASILNIRFAPMPGSPAAVSAAAPSSAPKPPAPKPPEKKLAIPKPTSPVVPVTKPAARPEPKTVPLSPFGRSSKKGSENAAPALPPPMAAPRPGTVGVGDVPSGGSGVTGLEGGDFPYTIYIDRMKTLIGSHWFRPQTGAMSTATVYFVIQRDGAIQEAKVETPSGDPTFDRAAIRAVLETSPLPSLPFGYNGTYLGVHLTFR